MKRAVLLLASIVLCLVATNAIGDDSSNAINLNDQRELFIDDYLIESMNSVELMIHRPERKEIAAVFDRPWELGNEGYSSIMKVDGKYVAYYRAWGIEYNSPMKYCCLFSDDGIHWKRPNLGICEFKKSKENNIFLDAIPNTQLGTHDFTPFIDERPGCPADERYKAIGHGFYAFDGKGPHGLFAWKSADGLHWSLMQDDPVYTDGKFDTQNIAFWSTVEKKYVLYYREFVGDVRVVIRATSEDFIHWTKEGQIQFPDGGGPTLREQFYTNQIQQYYRAPQIYIGLPTRYVDNGLTESTKLLPEWGPRQYRMTFGERIGTATTDILFISSRDGVNFRRGNDVFIAPGLRKSSNWFYGDNYAAWNIIETESAEDDSPRELSIYSTEQTISDKPARLRRYALRIDGFGSLHAKSNEGEVVTKQLIFAGDELSINYATSSAGYVKIEVLDAQGNAVPGFSFDDCDLLFGDSLDRRVSWRGSADMSQLAGKPIQLRFKMYEADVYSLKWEKSR